MVKTVNGEDVTFRVDDRTVFVADAKGDVARVTISDVMHRADALSRDAGVVPRVGWRA